MPGLFLARHLPREEVESYSNEVGFAGLLEAFCRLRAYILRGFQRNFNCLPVMNVDGMAGYIFFKSRKFERKSDESYFDIISNIGLTLYNIWQSDESWIKFFMCRNT